MDTIKFKTNINCDACLAKVTPVLDGNDEISNWAVDLGNPDKILTVQTAALDEEELVHSLKKVGYKAEKVE